MHPSAFANAQRFADTYLSNQVYTLVELGSQCVLEQPSLRSVFVGASPYLGLDCQSGEGVDIVMPDADTIPLEDASADVVISSSCLEHAEFFWMSFLEMTRILKQGGLLYINAPSNGEFHRHPVDCWRFYPDSGSALQKWAHKNGHTMILLESFISNQERDIWNDFVAVFGKGMHAPEIHTRRILETFSEFTNGRLHGSAEFRNHARDTEDMARRRLATFYLDYPTQGSLRWQ